MGDCANVTQASALQYVLYPRSVAVVGASANPTGGGGTGFVSRLRDLEFPGGIYPVNPTATEIQGLKAYPNVKSIPKPVDFVIVAVPASRVPEVLEDSVASVATLRRDFALASIPAYTSPVNAAKALARFVKYHQFQARSTDSSQ